MKPKRIEILDVPVDCVDMQDALEFIDKLIQKNNKASSIIAINPEKIMAAQKSSLLLHQLHNASLLIPDGIGVVFAAQLLGLGKLFRVPGSDLMPEICKRSVEKGYKIFLYGSSAKVNAKVMKSLRKRYTGINIVGNQHGYLNEDEHNELIEQINRSKAEILFIALGSPRQEIWMKQNLAKLTTVKVCQGVGGTFDVLAGSVKRAPKLFLYLNLEWLYRLITNPSRLMRQKALPVFSIMVMKCLFSGRAEAAKER
jgi:N-acetylglucosaminyldiphosphoundecaprenol N-acetyl-beta-D-mannosaminyltransferase